MSQPFPQVNAPLTDPKTGSITPVWRALLQSLWTNQGGATGSVGAPAAGNANQVFNVATAVGNSQAVPLAQADGRYAALAGLQTQAFNVGNAASGSNQAIRRSQVEGLFVAFAGTGSAIVPVTVSASPFTYTATAGGALAISGGTVSGVTLTRAGVSVPVAVGTIPLRNGDAVAITYTATPTVNFIPT